MIRILQVGMSPYYGGTEAFLMSQYRAIDRTKIQFDFLNVYGEKIACQDEIEVLGGHIYYLDMARHRGIRKYYQRLNNFFAKYSGDIDVVHCNFQSLINIDILKYAKKYGIKVRIAHAHNSGYGSEPSKVQKAIISLNRIFLKKYATHYFACSPLAAQWMFGQSAVIVKNAIELNQFLYSEKIRMAVRERLGLENCFTVMFVGRLDPQKNPVFLLEIFRELKIIRSDARLIVVGDGALSQQMHKKIREFEIEDSVKMLGSRSDVNELLQAADVFLLPSKFEGLGIVLIEAQAAGLPTFTSAGVVPDDAKISELLEFVPLIESPKEWASRIAKTSNVNRENMKECISQAGYDNYENAKKLERTYLSCIAE